MIVSNVDSGTLYTINGYAVDSVAMCNLRLSSQPSAYISATYNNNLLFTASAVSGTPMQYFTVPKGTIITTVADTDREYKRVEESSVPLMRNSAWVSGKCISSWREINANTAEIITLRDNTISFRGNSYFTSVLSPTRETSKNVKLSSFTPAYYSSMYASGYKSDWTAYLRAIYASGELRPTGSQKVNIKYVFPGIANDPSGYLNSAGVSKTWSSYPTSLKNFTVSTATTVLASASGDIPPYVDTTMWYTTLIP